MTERRYQMYPAEEDFAAHGGEATILWFIIGSIVGVIGGGKYAPVCVKFKREML